MFWKAGVIGGKSFGPSSYWLKGFIVLKEGHFSELKSRYSLSSKVKLEFSDGIDPAITGFTEFDWRYDKELSYFIMGGSFIGDIYLDYNNGVIYFDLENL